MVTKPINVFLKIRYKTFVTLREQSFSKSVLFVEKKS